MRVNASGIAQAAGLGTLAKAAGLDEGAAAECLDGLAGDIGRLPQSADERRFDRALAGAALEIAVTRHAGRVNIVQTVTGPVSVQTGKDLGAVGTLIGTGGVLALDEGAASVLARGLADPAQPDSLRPKAPALLLDRDYVLFACGLLAGKEPEAALTLGMRHLHPVGETPGDMNTDGRNPAA